MLRSREYLGEMFKNNKNILFLVFIKWLPCDRQWTKCPAVQRAPSNSTDMFPWGRKQSPNYNLPCLDTDENRQKLNNYLFLPPNNPLPTCPVPQPSKKHRFDHLSPT